MGETRNKSRKGWAILKEPPPPRVRETTKTRTVNPKGEQQRFPGQAWGARDSHRIRLGGGTRGFPRKRH